MRSEKCHSQSHFAEKTAKEERDEEALLEEGNDMEN